MLASRGTAEGTRGVTLNLLNPEKVNNCLYALGRCLYAVGDRMQVRASVIITAAGLSAAANSARDYTQTHGRTWQGRMSDFIFARHLQQLMPCSQRLLNYLWRLLAARNVFLIVYLVPKALGLCADCPNWQPRKSGLCKQGAAVLNYR